MRKTKKSGFANVVFPLTFPVCNATIKTNCNSRVINFRELLPTVRALPLNMCVLSGLKMKRSVSRFVLNNLSQKRIPYVLERVSSLAIMVCVNICFDTVVFQEKTTKIMRQKASFYIIQ